MEIKAQIIGMDKADITPALVKFLDDFANDIPTAYREVTKESTPKGKLYRGGAITTRYSKKLERAGLQRRGSSRLVSGRRIHRASAADQPAAELTGKLLRNIKVAKRGKFGRAIIFGANYSGYVAAIRPVGFEQAIQRAADRTIFE